MEPVLLVTVNVTVFDPAVVNVWLGFREVLVPPSPKFHCHDVGLPVDVSVKATDCPAAGEAGLYVKDAMIAATTVTVWLILFDPELFVTVNVTVFDPAVVNVWLGFREVLVPPSPKFHCRDVGLPVDLSVKATDCPAAGEAGLYVKDAVSVSTGETVTVRLTLAWPDAFIIVRVTLNDPAAVKMWLGF
jgi:metal-sulfur cluster biosynthetic enzyme